MADSSNHSISSERTVMSDPNTHPRPTTGLEHVDSINVANSPVGNRDTKPATSFKIGAKPPPIFHETPHDLEHYFTGPRDIARHSKWPLILRVHGSILPRLILPVLFFGAWATGMILIHNEVYDISVDSILLTILGFVVGLSLTFRCSTAYERYNEGRRCWSQLVQGSQSLGRVIWIHVNDEGCEDSQELTIRKLSAMNLVVAFSIALKHALRFEPYSGYPDLKPLIGHLEVMAQESVEDETNGAAPKRKNFFKSTGEYLGFSFASSNPRKALKKAAKPLGNLPLEILNYLALSIDSFHLNNQIRVFNHEAIAYNQITLMNDIMINCKRVLDTPLPIAYSIAISQTAFVYVLLLPFQLIDKLSWVTIPATMVAAYVILGLLYIGQEIENPFGFDVNDLPLEDYCEQIAEDMDITASHDKRETRSFHLKSTNMPLYPVSKAPASAWTQRDGAKLQETIRMKPKTIFEMRQQTANGNQIATPKQS